MEGIWNFSLLALSFSKFADPLIKWSIRTYHIQTFALIHVYLSWCTEHNASLKRKTNPWADDNSTSLLFLSSFILYTCIRKFNSVLETPNSQPWKKVQFAERTIFHIILANIKFNDYEFCTQSPSSDLQEVQEYCTIFIVLLHLLYTAKQNLLRYAGYV